jgi:hypothetical protein
MRLAFDDSDIRDALEIAAGTRLRSGISERTTPSDGDMRITARVILLFLENLDDELSVSELRRALET